MWAGRCLCSVQGWLGPQILRFIAVTEKQFREVVHTCPQEKRDCLSRHHGVHVVFLRVSYCRLPVLKLSAFRTVSTLLALIVVILRYKNCCVCTYLHLWLCFCTHCCLCICTPKRISQLYAQQLCVSFMLTIECVFVLYTLLSLCIHAAVCMSALCTLLCICLCFYTERCLCVCLSHSLILTVIQCAMRRKTCGGQSYLHTWITAVPSAGLKATQELS